METFYFIIFTFFLKFIKANQLFLQNNRFLSECPSFNQFQSKLQQITYIGTNNKVRIYMETRLTKKQINIKFFNIYNDQLSYSILCNVTEDTLIECTIDSVDTLPPGLYNMAINEEYDNCLNSTFWVLLTQTERVDKQIVVTSLNLTNSTYKCTSSEKFVLSLNNSVDATNVNGFFSQLGLNSRLDFTCNNIDSNTKKLECSFTNPNSITDTRYYSLNSLFYTIDGKVKNAFINTNNDYIAYNYNYNAFVSAKEIQNINNNETSNFYLQFQKTTPDPSTDLQLLKDNEPIFHLNGRCSFIESTTILNCTINERELPTGSYQINYKNQCEENEILSTTINSNVSLIIECPNFTLIEGSTCAKSFDSFIITGTNIEEATLNINGSMISEDKKILPFTCENFIEGQHIQQKTCKFNIIPETGVYHIYEIDYTLKSDNSTNREAYLKYHLSSNLTINTTLIPLVIPKQVSTIDINYGKFNTFELQFESLISSLPIIFLEDDELRKYGVKCEINTINRSLVLCTISDPTVIPQEMSYTVFVENVEL